MSSSMQLPPGLRPAPPPSSGGGGGAAQGAGGGPSQEEQAARQAQDDEMRRGILSQVLEPEARERREWFFMFINAGFHTEQVPVFSPKPIFTTCLLLSISQHSFRVHNSIKNLPCETTNNASN
jgi:hypothetical protein